LLSAPKRRFLRLVFLPAARYPADPRAIFVLAASVLAGITAIAIQSTPPSLEALLPRWGVVLWGIFLVFGSALTLFGMSRQGLNGIQLEQIGSTILGIATVYYATLVLFSVGTPALMPVGLTLSWGLACLLRAAQLQALLGRAIRAVENEHPGGHEA
jgi:hypothetical protein